MSKQEIRIYALPTNKLSNIFKCHNDYFQYDEDKGENYEKSSIEFYHLYVISNEELKESEISKGEGYYNMNTNKIHIWGTSNYYDIKGKRKILSTDDKDLKSDTRVKCPECNATGFKDFPNSCINCNRTGVVLKSLPLISPEFQQAWVREMNNSTPIVDVIMEMEEIYHPPVISGGLRPIGEIGGKELTHFPSSIEYKPKLNPQGYVTILPVKEKMYPLDALRESFKGARRLLPSNDEESDFNKWLKMYETVNL